MKAASVSDYRELARRRLPHFLFEYIDGGSYAEVTLHRNSDDLRNVALRQRVLKNVSQIDTSTTLFDQKLALPVALGPVGLSGLYARRGEVLAARAAENAGIPFSLSTVSVCTIDEVRRSTTKPYWFQLYMMQDRSFVRNLMAQAEAAHCSALIVTVDKPVLGSRYRDIHSGLASALGISGAIRWILQSVARPRWAWDIGIMGRPHVLGNIESILKGEPDISDFFAWMRNNFDASITWRDLEFVRAEWKGPLLIKGLLDAEDARLAVKLGADGIVVSNHGGRQLDGALSTVKALPAIVDAVGDDLTVLVDGGIRSGLDVVRMLALGAKGILLGRAWAYALAANGEAGVTHMLQLIETEMRVAMALAGVTSISDINRNMLVSS
jgi:L-lactate dehydrogenase (cytochrome)